MAKYNVEIKEVLMKTIEVEASSKVEAETKAREMRSRGDVVLTADDFAYVEFLGYREEWL